MEMDEKRQKRYRGIGLTILWVAFVICIIIFILMNFRTVWSGIQKFLGVLTPFVYGIALCYLTNPLYNKVHKWTVEKTGKKKLAKVIGSAAAIVTVLLFIYGVSALLMPKLVESVRNLYEKTPEMAEKFMNWYGSLAEKEFLFKEQILIMIQSMIDYADSFVTTDIVPNLNVIATKLYSSVMSVAGFLYDFLLGLVAMVYLLLYKEQLVPAAKRLVYSLIPKYADDFCIKVKRFNEIFGGFILGKLLDSLIIGILCFIGMTVFRMPYALLVSVIVGVTNVIPFFGPLIGAIPCAFIILIISPEKGLFFIFFILALQQLDGNLIGPKILGDTIGISSISVLFSIIVGGGLFGFVGMLLAVPSWAFIKYLINEFAESRLKKAGLPTGVESYGSGMHPAPELPEEDGREDCAEKTEEDTQENTKMQEEAEKAKNSCKTESVEKSGAAQSDE